MTIPPRKPDVWGNRLGWIVAIATVVSLIVSFIIVYTRPSQPQVDSAPTPTLPSGTAVPVRTAVAAARATELEESRRQGLSMLEDRKKDEQACLVFVESTLGYHIEWVTIDGPTIWQSGAVAEPTKYLLPEGLQVYVHWGSLKNYAPHCTSILQQDEQISKDWQKPVRDGAIVVRP